MPNASDTRLHGSVKKLTFQARTERLNALCHLHQRQHASADEGKKKPYLALSIEVARPRNEEDSPWLREVLHVLVQAYVVC